mmetsp:Transcript_7618/g.30887  ORF Transcript_7618/g.30887 Transcript_7618/m.30887 type:complete len:205 (+) Transcript_7618:632-1246(+)
MNKTRTMAPTVNRAPPRNLHRSDSMSTSLKKPHDSDSSACIAIFWASRGPCLVRGDPGDSLAVSLAVSGPSPLAVSSGASTSSALNSARSSETRCPRAIASAAVAVSHGCATRCARDLAIALPEPAGTTPTGKDCARVASGRVMRPLNTSASVPSPPTHTTALYASRSSAPAIFIASPRSAVTRISTTTPHPLNAASTGATSRS